MRIFFTGGSGKAGKHAIDHLVAQGHRVTNADLTPLGRADVPDLRIDLTDAGLARPVRFVARKSMFSQPLVQNFYRIASRLVRLI